MSRTIRLTALALAILAFFFFVGSPFGQSAKAIAGVDDAIIVILIAALAACGITFVTSGSFASMQEYVSSLLEEYAQDRGVTFNSLFKGVDSGVSSSGQILVNNKFVILVQTFGAWLKAKFALNDNETITVRPSAASVGTLAAYELPLALVHRDNTVSYTYQYFRGNGALILFQGDSTLVQPRFVSDSPCQVELVTVWSGGSFSEYIDLTWNESFQKYFAAQYVAYTVESYPVLAHVVAYTAQEIEQNLSGTIRPAEDTIGLNTGAIELPADNSNYTEGDGAVIDVNGFWGADYDDIIDGVIPGEFAFDEVGEASIEYVTEEEAAEQVVESQAQVIGNDPSDYQSPGLTDVFPFCIPFDIYAFFECLAADPVAPAFTWRFYVPGICDEEFTVDLAPFNSVAQIVRTMELLAFIVGLALMTRDKFLRG